MKRQYVTPVIVAEKFSITQSVPACQIKISFLDSECVKKDMDATDQMKYMAWSDWFTSGNCQLEVIGNTDVEEDGICYHTNTRSAFNS